MVKKIKEIRAANDIELDDLVKDFMKENYIQPSKILERKDIMGDGKYIARVTYEDDKEDG